MEAFQGLQPGNPGIHEKAREAHLTCKERWVSRANGECSGRASGGSG